MFLYEDDAKAVMEVLPKRLAKFSLEVEPDKTRILAFRRFRGTKDDFDFLGFIFFNTKTRTGKYRLDPYQQKEAKDEATGSKEVALRRHEATASAGNLRENGRSD